MKKAIFLTTALALGAFILINSCSKPYYMTSTTTSVNDPSGTRALFAELRSTPQTITGTAGTAFTFTGAKGTILKFYPNSFMDANGHILTSGTVTMQLVEMYTAGDKIMNKSTAMAGGAVLKSGGQINLTATINGQTVYAHSYGISFPQGAASYDTMRLFAGNNNNNDSTITWNQDSTTTFAMGTSSSSPFVYLFDSCNHFGWTNCDQFYWSGDTLTTVSAVLPDISFNASNTQIYLVLPSVKSVMSNVNGFGQSGYDSTTHTISLISEGNTKIVPKGMAYKLVLLCKKGGTYYYYQTSGNVTDNMKPIVAFTAKTYSEVVSLLQAL